MIAETLRDKLAQEPFVPFIIRASSGQAYRVANPELVVLQRTKVFVGEPRSDRSATIPYLHVAAVEELDNGNGNGHKRPRRRNRR
jgi:hypothetical protein